LILKDLRVSVRPATFSFFILVFLNVFTPSRIAAQTPEPSPAQNAVTPEIDLVHMGDVVDVDFAGGFEYDWRGPLTAEGNLEGLDSLSGPIPALCRSESEIAADIIRIYSKILRDPQVKVKVIDRSGRPVVRILGAVKTPMRFRLMRPVHLRELLIAAGGLTDESSGDISILRPPGLSCEGRVATAGAEDPQKPNLPSGNGPLQLNITIKDLLTGKTAADPLILSGDIITVTRSQPIYIMGAVNNPRPIYSHGEMTLSRAIDSAGGLSKGALIESITIFRREAGESRVITADLEKIKNGVEGDIDLKAFDIIDVAFRGRAKRKYPPVIANGSGSESLIPEPPLKIIE
jgi:protein involved in polysaccharide export with SLBB domain